MKYTNGELSRNILKLAACLVLAPAIWAGPPRELRTGVAQYAFDHTGDLTNLAATCRASGSTVIFSGSVGAYGYLGLPDEQKLAAVRSEEKTYLKGAKSQGIELAIGYVCATSIVHLGDFDKNWSPKFRAQFHSAPAQWRQQDKNGQPLASWYGAPYEPACMNNPDWRTYEKYIIRLQLESGCDGIFFDNPTVHQNGCYCPFCMEKFDAFLAAHHPANRPGEHTLAALRQWAGGHPAEFMEFRANIATDFLTEMRACARSIKSHALMTCNNSLNVPDVLFSQSRTMGYNIYSSSQAEDFVTIEDMSTGARKLADGRTIEYGPTYNELQAICHGKPIVATTLAESDYHVAPDLGRLSMAEAAAHDASWLLWPTWPTNTSAAMAAAIFPEADLLRRNEKLLNNTEPRRDVLVFLSFRRWLETDHCVISSCVAALTQANIQYAVCSEEDLAKDIASGPPISPLLLIESYSVLNSLEKEAIDSFKAHGGKVVAADERGWMGDLRHAIEKPAIEVRGPATVRAVVRDQPKRAIVHLYNLDIVRLSSFEDQVHPAQQIGLTLRVPFRRVRSVRALTADAGTTGGALPFSARADGNDTVVELTCPKLEISAILVVEP